MMISATHVRRGGAAFLAAAVTAGILAGCSTSGNGADAGNQFSLTFPHAENSPYAAMAEKYMEANPEVTITVDPIPSDSYDSLLRTQLQGGNAADVFMATPGSGAPIALIALAEAGLISPLDGTADSLVPEASRDLFFVDDEMYGLPTDISVTSTIFNSTAGPAYPGSMDELMALCSTQAAEGVAFFALAGTVPINAGIAALSIAASRVYAEQPEWDKLREAGEVTFADTAGWRASLEVILELQEAQCFQPGAEGAGFEAIVGGFGQGNALSAFIPGGVIPQLSAGLPDDRLVVEAFPAEAGGTPFVFASSDYAMAISASSKHKPAAQDYLNWLAEPEQAAEYALLAGSLPVSGIEGFELEGTSYEPVADLIAAGDYTTLPVNSWSNPSVFDTLGGGVQALLTGQKNVDDVLAELDAAWED